MNQLAKIDIRHSTCPHDCPSACGLDIEVIDNSSIGRVRGSKLQTYTAGVVCAKVARYAERIHHPDRLTYPQFRVGPKGSGKFARISWDDALDESPGVSIRPSASSAPNRCGLITMPAPWAW